jgi:hypothetical protein
MKAVSYYWWKREPRYIIQCIWEETTDLPQLNWKTFSHSHIGPSRIRTDAGWRWEVSWSETDGLATRPRRRLCIEKESWRLVWSCSRFAIVIEKESWRLQIWSVTTPFQIKWCMLRNLVSSICRLWSIFSQCSGKYFYYIRWQLYNPAAGREKWSFIQLRNIMSKYFWVGQSFISPVQ